MRLHLIALLLAFAAVLVLTGCGAQPAPEFFGAERQQVTRDGRTYVLFRKGNRVEVIRLGHAGPGQHRAIRATMIALIPELTGCQPEARSLQGDSGEMRGTLRCASF